MTPTSIRLFLLILMLGLPLPVLAQVPVPGGAGAPPMPGSAGGQTLLSGQAPPIPVPPPSVMASTQRAPGAAPAGSPAPAGAGPQAAATKASLPRQDTLTLADIADKLTATRDFYWETNDKLMMIDYLSQIKVQQDKLAQLQN